MGGTSAFEFTRERPENACFARFVSDRKSFGVDGRGGGTSESLRKGGLEGSGGRSVDISRRSDVDRVCFGLVDARRSGSERKPCRGTSISVCARWCWCDVLGRSA